MRSKNAAKNIVVSLLLQCVVIICGFIVPRLIIESFGSDVNGLITSITQFLAYITLLESGVAPVIKAKLYKPIARNDKKTIRNILFASERFFRKIAYIFIVYVVILCVIYPLIVARDFEIWFSVSLLIIIAVSTFAEYYFGMTYRAFLQAKQKTYVTSYIQIGTTIVNTICVVVLIKIGCGVLLVKLLSSLIFIARPLLQSWYVKRHYKLDYRNVDKGYKLTHKWDGMAQHIASVVHSNTDVVILTIFSGVAEVSVYSVYMLVVNGVKRISEALTGGIDASFGDMIAKGEDEHLKDSFGVYEFLFFTLITIIFSCTLVLVVPFVALYTSGVTDADYVRPIFAFLIVLAEFVHSIRMPYNLLTLAAGHFRETMIGAWLEAGLNIVISIVLVFRFGIVGVAIGTLVAMFIRTIEFTYHASKYILKRKYINCVKKMVVLMLETAVIMIIVRLLPLSEIVDLTGLIGNALLTLCVACAVVLCGNIFCYRSDLKFLQMFMKNAFRKRRKYE